MLVNTSRIHFAFCFIWRKIWRRICRTIFVRYCPEFSNSYSFDRLHMLLYMTERNLSRGSGIFLVNGNRELYSPLGNTAQNPPDGFARNLRADFPSYCPEIPCHTAVCLRNFWAICRKIWQRTLRTSFVRCRLYFPKNCCVMDKMWKSIKFYNSMLQFGQNRCIIILCYL